MTIKLFGAFLVFAGCGGFGFLMASSHRREEHTLRQYLMALEYMECELGFRLTPLPQLCRAAANAVSGSVHTLLLRLADELDAQIFPDVSLCMAAAIAATPELSTNMREMLTELGTTLGRFDLPGQLKGLGSAALRAQNALSALEHNREGRLRSYQTLGLCAGAALAILFL